MSTSPIYRALTLSVFIHISLFIIAFFIIKHSNIQKKTEPYIVSLIEESRISSLASSTGSQEKTSSVVESPMKQQAAPSKTVQNQKSEKLKVQDDDKIVQDRIAALQAKKKIEKIVALRKVIDIEGKRNIPAGGGQKLRDKVASSGSGASTAGNDYYSMIVKKIRQEWVFPEPLEKNLEAIVSIKISKDGSVRIDRIEKSSGNQLFDRYALRAINKASPLPPPPQEMEVGVRFYP